MKGKQNKGNEEQKTATKGLIRFDTANAENVFAKTKRSYLTSPFGASKQKLNLSGRDIPVKVGSGEIAGSTRVA